MFNKIMKRGQKKPSKPEVIEPPMPPPAAGAGGPNVTVNHASRTATAGAGPPPPVTLTFDPNNPGPVEVLPLLKEVPLSERHNLFIKKLQICSNIFDFTEPMRSAREKEIKRQTLVELVALVQSGSYKLNEIMQEGLVLMVSANIFRCLPPSMHENSGMESIDPEEDDMFMDPSWPHLQLVYELLLKYVESKETDTKVAKRYIDHTFVSRLLDLFDSEDPRERDYLKTILHRVYGKFMVHRPYIRNLINNIFYRFIFETQRHSGIGELLEVLGSIINGFALPMKEEHKLFLIRALIPLHKPKCVAIYHLQLSYCITQFVEKDYRLADVVILGLLKYWPLTNCGKEVLFLGELEEVLECTQPQEFQRCIVPLFRQVARSINSPHFQTLRSIEQYKVPLNNFSEVFPIQWGSFPPNFTFGNSYDRSKMSFIQTLNYKCLEEALLLFHEAIHIDVTKVAERALFWWNNDHIIELIAQNRQAILPIIFEALEKNIQGHWNQAILGLTSNVRRMFQEMDAELFEECQKTYEEKLAKSKDMEEQRELVWQKLEEAATEADGKPTHARKRSLLSFW